MTSSTCSSSSSSAPTFSHARKQEQEQDQERRTSEFGRWVLDTHLPEMMRYVARSLPFELSNPLLVRYVQEWIVQAATTGILPAEATFASRCRAVSAIMYMDHDDDDYCEDQDYNGELEKAALAKDDAEVEKLPLTPFGTWVNRSAIPNAVALLENHAPFPFTPTLARMYAKEWVAYQCTGVSSLANRTELMRAMCVDLQCCL